MSFLSEDTLLESGKLFKKNFQSRSLDTYAASSTQCPNFRGLFTSKITWYYAWHLKPKRWILRKHDAKDTHGKLVFLSGYLCGSLRVFHSPCMPRVHIALNLLMCWFALLWTRKILIRHFQRHQLTSNSGVLRTLVNMWFVVCRRSSSAIEILAISRIRPPKPPTLYSVS